VGYKNTGPIEVGPAGPPPGPGPASPVRVTAELDLPHFLRVLPWAALCVVVLCLLGWRESPRDREGRPYLLTPANRAIRAYMSVCTGWRREMDRIRLELLAEDGTEDFYSRSVRMQQLYEQAVGLQTAVARRSAPAALLGLRQRFSTAAGLLASAARYSLEPVQAAGDRQKRDEALASLESLLGEIDAILAELEEGR